MRDCTARKFRQIETHHFGATTLMDVENFEEVGEKDKGNVWYPHSKKFK